VSFIASVAIFEVILVAMLAAFRYGPYLLLWGFQNNPRTTGVVFALCVGAVVLAAATYTRLFPQCHFHLGVARPVFAAC